MSQKILSQLLSEDRLTIQQGLEALTTQFPKLTGGDFEEAAQAVMGLFYVDTYDHPEMIPVLEQAETLLADQGEQVIEVVLDSLEESDLKTHFHLVAVFAKMGRIAITPLLDAYEESESEYVRAFILYAIGKIKDPDVLAAKDLLLDALDDASGEIRDTAARALGKICESLNPALLDEETRTDFFEGLKKAASDHYAGVRSKSFRSLGKMTKNDLLTDQQRQAALNLLMAAAGKNSNNWDVAYVARAEAQKALKFF